MSMALQEPKQTQASKKDPKTTKGEFLNMCVSSYIFVCWVSMYISVDSLS